MRKKLLYIFFAGLIFLLNANAFSQKQKPKNDSWYDDKRLHFGFSLGLNLMDFNINPTKKLLDSDPAKYLLPEVSILNPGINIQIVTNLHLAKYFDLRFLPGVSFGQRNIRFYEEDAATGKFFSTYNEKQRVESSFLEFPLLLKYKGMRLNNVRPYVIGGINYRYDLAGKKEYDEEKQIWLRLRRSDLYYEAGAGLDFYLRYFKLSVELKMSNGIRDVLVHEPAGGHGEFVNAIDRMHSQIWVLSFHFE
ncbi:MAG: porin family protein [Bacteroidota bacterium]|nr:porin family protein [Bacteroidota bacterium]